MNAIPYKDIPDIRPLFDSVSNDKRVAGAFLYAETLDIYKMLGIPLPRRRQREVFLIGAIREKLQESDIPLPTCDCPSVDGRRWSAADNEIAITYALHPSLSALEESFLPYINESFGFVASIGHRLKFRVAQRGETPQILVMAQPYDGPGRTLGVTIYYDNPTLELDVDLPNNTPPVRVIIDTAETWTLDYFRTVLRHELFHAVGIGHSPEWNDLMWPSYRGVRLTHPGVWTQAEMDLRYLARVISS